MLTQLILKAMTVMCKIVAETPDGDGALTDLSTPPGTQSSSSF